MQDRLEQLYLEAKVALKAKGYDRAADLFRQILQIDENYKDASRLLAKTVKLRRRRWYSHPLLGGILGIATLVGLGVLLAPKLGSLAVRSVPTLSATPTTAMSMLSPTLARSPTPPPIPMAWKRLSTGLEFPRDTITAVAVDPSDSEVLYVGTQNAGIYKTIDGGQSWQPILNGLARAAVLSFVIDFTEPQILYAGTDQGGVFKSINGGQTWDEINNGIKMPGWNTIAIVVMDRMDSHHLFFLNGFELYESDNAGGNWKQVSIPGCVNGFPVEFAIHPTDNQNRYTFLLDMKDESCIGGVYVTYDGGRTWNQSGLIDMQIRGGGLSLDSSEGNTLYAVTDNGTFRSPDRGGTWTFLTGGFCDRALAIDPINPKIIYCSGWGNSLAISNDSGDNWTLVDTLGDIGWVNTISVTSGNPQLILVGAQGLYQSRDGSQTWVKRDNGIGGGFVELYLHPADGSIIFAEQNDGRLYRSMDKGFTWDLVENQGRWLVFDSPGEVLFRSMQDAILVSRDNGDTWKQLDAPSGNPGALGFSTGLPGVLFIAPADWGENKPYFISSDDGMTWTQRYAFIPGGFPRFVFGDNQGKRIYWMGDVAFIRSDDGGLTWQNCEGVGDGFYSNYGPRLAVDPRDPNHLFLGTRVNGIFESFDGCTSWQQKNIGLSSLYVSVIAFDPNNSDTIFAGTDGGAYVSFNGGQSWGEINDGLLGATVIYSIVVDSDSNVYASTPYGVFILESK